MVSATQAILKQGALKNLFLICKKQTFVFIWKLKLFKRSPDLREAPRARLSPWVESSGFPPPAPEGRHGIGQIREVGCWMRTSAAIYHTHYSTVLRNRGKNSKQQLIDHTVPQISDFILKDPYLQY